MGAFKTVVLQLQDSSAPFVATAHRLNTSREYLR